MNLSQKLELYFNYASCSHGGFLLIDTIPGVFTFKSKGEYLANLTESGIPVEMQIEEGEKCTRPYANINR